MSAFNPDASQLAALKAMMSWYNNPNPVKGYFTVHGLAGTGKTALMCHVVEQLPRAVLCAPTNKAVVNLRNKTGRKAATIHNLIYKLKAAKRDEQGRTIMEWEGKPFYADVVLVDECSMIDRKTATDLIGKVGKVIAFGDPGQLPPVNGEQFFTIPDAELTTNHRTKDSGIIRQAMNVRHDLPCQPDGELVIAPDVGTAQSYMRLADMVVVPTNAWRTMINNWKRGVLGHPADTIVEGEPLMCLRKDYAARMFNGEVYEVAKDRSPGGVLFVKNNGLKPVKACIEGIDPDFDEQAAMVRPTKTLFAPGYAATAHKVQGSEFPRVLVIDDGANPRNQWLYTAITRAQEKAAIWTP